jgi:hypothetical protein
VNASTEFDQGLEFSSALEGQRVTVDGVLTVKITRGKPDSRPVVNVNLVAAHVHAATSSTESSEDSDQIESEE